MRPWTRTCTPLAVRRICKCSPRSMEYAALLTAYHRAMIMLHEPWASWENPTCPSADKVLNASRALMTLMYSIASTSFDVSLLDFLPYVGGPLTHCYAWLLT